MAANQNITGNLIAAHAMTILAEEMDRLGGRVYCDNFKRNGARVGDQATIRDKRKIRPMSQFAMTGSGVWVTETSVKVLFEHCKTVQFDFESMMSASEAVKRYIHPPMLALRGEIKKTWGLGATLVTADLPCNASRFSAISEGIVNGGELSAHWSTAYDVRRACHRFEMTVLYGFYGQPPELPNITTSNTAILAGAKVERQRLQLMLEKVRERRNKKPDFEIPDLPPMFDEELLETLKAEIRSQMGFAAKIGNTIHVRKPPRFNP
jgi:hypothetical protein